MATKRAPRFKQSRRLGVNITSNPKALDRLGKTGPAGNSQRRQQKKQSEYGRQLTEKQKVKAYYGIYERQLRRYFELASRKGGKPGETLLIMLETRLDNLVYRMGFANSIAMARQMVSHKHFEVDGQPVNMPAYSIQPGQTIRLREKSREVEPFKANWSSGIDVLPYISTDREAYSGALLKLPERVEIPVQVDEQLIVEFYSR